MMQSNVLYSRYEDGARAVLAVDGGWQVGGKLHKTAVALLADLTGHPTGRHWSLDRYFKTGSYAEPAPVGQTNVFDLFPVQEQAKTLTEGPLAPSIVTLTTMRDPQKRHPHRRPRPKKTEVVMAGPVGIDLVNRSHEVRKLLFKGFGRRIRTQGYDGEDVLQEVYRGLLARNKGKCPWDPSKSSFGHYVHMVSGCILSNYHRKQRRRRQFETIGLSGYQSDGEFGVGDAGSTTVEPAEETTEFKHYLLHEAADDLVDFMLKNPEGPQSGQAQLAVDVLPYVVGGLPRKAIAAELGVSMAAISRAVSFLRQHARLWGGGRA